MTGSDSFVLLDKDKRTLKPVMKVKVDTDRFTTKEKRNKYLKRKKAYMKRNQTILLILKERANNAKPYLARDLQKFKCDIKAFDFLVENMDPMSVDPTNENAESFEKIQRLELTSIATGIFSKCYSLFERHLDELVESQGVQLADEDMKSLLLSKLKHASYAQMKLPLATRNDFTTYIKELRQFSVIIEKESNTRSYKKALLNNTNTSTSDSRSQRVIDTVLGMKIDQRGNVNRAEFR